MTYSKLPGVYFSETVTSQPEEIDPTIDYVPLFVVQTSTEIEQIDDKLAYFEGLEALHTLVDGKGLTKSVETIEKTLTQYKTNRFYVYNIHTDTSASINTIISNCVNKKEIIDVVLIEETKSAQANNINTKIKALQSALNNNFENGAFRTAIILPYGTVADAVANKGENDKTSTVVINTLTTAFNGVTDGRIIGVVPDEQIMGAMTGQILASPFYRESGFDAIEFNGTLDYEFDYNEMLTLQNMGICFAREESRNGVKQYHINLGVTTSFANSSADGLIKARKTVDEVLRRVGAECENLIKSEDVETSNVFIQSECDAVINDFIENRYILKSTVTDGVTYTSKLTASVVDKFTINVTGTIIPSGCLIAVNVNTTIR